MGYTPAFDSFYEGTLCGKWPEAAVFASLLPLIDAQGNIDKSFAAIAALTGWPMDLLKQGIAQLMEPDPESRSGAEEGRRLVLIEPSRSWGWHVVNHGKYREKARKAAFDAARQADGRNAARMRARHAEQSGDPTRPAMTRDDPPSNSNSNSNPSKKVPTEPVEHGSTEDCIGTVERVFRHWRETHGHPRASLDAKRRRVIATALKTYSEADLCLCITGYLNSPHHMGQNDRGTRYDDIELFLRDAKHVDAGIRFHAEPPRNLSSLTRRNVAAVEDWQPPEVRNATG